MSLAPHTIAKSEKERFSSAANRPHTPAEPPAVVTDEIAELYLQVFEQLTDATAIIDESGEFLSVNRPACAVLGMPRENLLAMNIHNFVVFRGFPIERLFRRVKQGLCNEGDVYLFLPDRGERIIEVECSPIFGTASTAQRYLATFRDVTEKRQLERDLLESEQKLKQMLSAVDEGIWDWNLETDEFTVNPAWLAMIGASSADFAGSVSSWESRLHPDEMDDLLSHQHQLRTGKVRRLELEHRLRHKVGHYIWVFARISVTDYDLTGRPARIVGTCSDITKRKSTEEARRFEAHRDALTGLLNAEGLRDRVKTTASVRRKSGSGRKEKEGAGPSAAALIIDLDGFKYINESLGRDAGDRVLQICTERLTFVINTEFGRQAGRVVLARTGANEFAVWFSDLRADADVSGRAAGLAQVILSALAQPIAVESSAGRNELMVTASIGIAVLPEGMRDIDTLLSQADTALHQAKKDGRGKFRFYTPEQSAVLANRLMLETRLRRAVHHKQFTVVYQPQVDTLTERITGVEALLRWNDAELGTVSPNVFIPVAEEIGLIHAIGDFVLRTAARQAMLWRATIHPSLRVSVNLSALQIVEASMIGTLNSVLTETSLPGDALEIELTESALIRSNDETARSFMAFARERGIRIAIDDFGTGYSSLAYLHSVIADVVKIDKGFIRDMLENRATRFIVEAIIQLSHALGLTVIAEGVENEAQRATLSALSCDCLQGYYYSEPKPAAHLACLLSCPSWAAR